MEFELPKDFKELFELFNANNVQYLLIGGYAVGLYGYARSTNDIDIFISDAPENLNNLMTALRQFGITEIESAVDLFGKKRSMLEMGVEPMKVQIMNFADGVDFDSAYARREVVKIEDILVHTIGKADLIKNKIASGRHKDLADVERLEETN